MSSETNVSTTTGDCGGLTPTETLPERFELEDGCRVFTEAMYTLLKNDINFLKQMHVIQLTNVGDDIPSAGRIVKPAYGDGNDFSMQVTAGRDNDAYGITLEPVAKDSAGRVMLFGHVRALAVSTDVNPGDYLASDAAGNVQSTNQQFGDGVFATAFTSGEAGGYVCAHVFGQQRQNIVSCGGHVAGGSTLINADEYTTAYSGTVTANTVAATGLVRMQAIWKVDGIADCKTVLQALECLQETCKAVQEIDAGIRNGTVTVDHPEGGTPTAELNISTPDFKCCCEEIDLSALKRHYAKIKIGGVDMGEYEISDRPRAKGAGDADCPEAWANVEVILVGVDGGGVLMTTIINGVPQGTQLVTSESMSAGFTVDFCASVTQSSSQLDLSVGQTKCE